MFTNTINAALLFVSLYSDSDDPLTQSTPSIYTVPLRERRAAQWKPWRNVARGKTLIVAPQLFLVRSRLGWLSFESPHYTIRRGSLGVVLLEPPHSPFPASSRPGASASGRTSA